MKPMEFWIKHLDLRPHPEGGYYREVYRSKETIPAEALTPRFSKEHAFSTAIYFLLPGDSFSAFHRLKSDEIWHFYSGHAITLFLLFPDGSLQQKLLGPDAEQGEQFQIVVPHDVWFAARVNNKKAYALVGCTVAPGFDFEDFELGQREALLKAFPQHKEIIVTLTRQ